MLERVGELAALATALCWCGSTLSFEEAGKRVGSLVVNLVRLVIAFAVLTGATWVMRGMALPTDASAHAWMWLSLSGLVGFTLGDMCLFRAFVLLGSRLSTLIMSLVPPVTALIGWLILGETMSATDMLGTSLTMTGVALAVTERAPAAPAALAIQPRNLGRGVLLGLGGVLGQAGGLVLSKYGMGSYNPMAATQIRIIAGTIGFALVFAAIGWWPRVWAARRSPGGLGFTTLGAIFGPVMGVSLSLYAVQHTSTGVAATIMSTSPVLIIPLVVVIHKERVSARGILGALVALAGVLLLFS